MLRYHWTSGSCSGSPHPDLILDVVPALVPRVILSCRLGWRLGCVCDVRRQLASTRVWDVDCACGVSQATFQQSSQAPMAPIRVKKPCFQRWFSTPVAAPGSVFETLSKSAFRELRADGFGGQPQCDAESPSPGSCQTRGGQGPNLTDLERGALGRYWTGFSSSNQRAHPRVPSLALRGTLCSTLAISLSRPRKDSVYNKGTKTGLMAPRFWRSTRRSIGCRMCSRMGPEAVLTT